MKLVIPLEASDGLAAQTITVDVRDALRLSLDPRQVMDILESHPGEFGFYGAAHAHAEAALARVKREEKILVAKVSEDLRQSEGKISEARIASLLPLNPDIQTMTDRVVRAQFAVDALKSVVDAFRHRRDCLLAIAHTFRSSDAPLPPIVADARGVSQSLRLPRRGGA